jgi:hypothetical protein
MPVTRLRRPPKDYRKLRPHPWLFRQGLVATLAFLVPTFGVLYFLTVPDGPWPMVIATQVFATVAVILACRSYFRVGIWIDQRGIAERGMLGRLTMMPTADIGSIVLVRTFEGGGAETVPQLFVCDHDGNQVIRLRGQFWSESDMRIVCDKLDVPVTRLNQSVTPRELLERYPGLLYWFERRPVFASALFSAAVLVIGTLLYLGLAALGIT